MMTWTIALRLPMPPSTNRLWRSVGRGNVIKSQAYRQWMKECDGLCLANGWHKATVPGLYEIDITFDRRACGHGADLGNREKPVSDWLQHAGIIKDDKLAERIELKWGDVPEGCAVLIRALDRARLTKDAAE